MMTIKSPRQNILPDNGVNHSTRNIVLLGLVSFFADLSTEMVYPLIPVYLVTIFGVTPAIVGLIEGIAESLAALLKVFSGYIADKYRHKKPLALAGYSGVLFYKLLLLLATSWGGVLVARIVDRIGKGLRTAPRDVLISENAPSSHLGGAFGLHKALDMAGSAAGIFLAWLLIRQNPALTDYRQLFLISCIPAVISLFLLLTVKEQKIAPTAQQQLPAFKDFKRLPKQLKIYLLTVFFFTLGNSSNAFLLLRAENIGFDPASIILLYLLFNLTASLLAIPLGLLSDRIGRKNLLVAAYAAYAAVYLLFGLAASPHMIIAAFALYGVYSAAIGGVERALVTEISPPHLKGTMLGLLSTLTSLALLPASLIAGVLWERISPAAPFLFGAALAALAAIALLLLLNNASSPQKDSES
ncbi:MAG: MFS transporter [Clostridiales bacterium]